MSERLSILIATLRRMAMTLEKFGPESEQAKALASEIRSAEIEPDCWVDYPQIWYKEHLEQQAEWMLGQSLVMIEAWPTTERGIHRIALGRAVINQCYKVADDLDSVVLEEPSR